MSTQFEDRLRDAMEQATGQVRLRPGLAARAFQHRQRRRVTARVVTAAGTAAVVAAGLAAAGAAGAFGSGRGTGPQQASYTAYVVRHVEHALAAPGQAHSVQYARSTYRPGTDLLHPAGPFSVRVSQGGPSSPWAVRYAQRWAYHNTARTTAFSPAGRPVFELGAKFPPARRSSIGVSWVNHTWWQQSWPPSPRRAARPRSTAGRRSRSRTAPAGPPTSATSWPAAHTRWPASSGRTGWTPSRS